MIGGKLSPISPPSSLIVVAQHWPGALIVALSLGIAVERAFINPRLQSWLQLYLDAKGQQVWPLDSVFTSPLHPASFVIISGTVGFLERLRGWLGGHSAILFLHEQDFHGVSFHVWDRKLKKDASVARKWGLHPVFFPHTAYGGATNAIHMVAFGPGSGLDVTSFQHPPNVARAVRHFWQSAARVPMTVISDPLPPPAHTGRVLFHNGGYRFEGLLSISNPTGNFYGPCALKQGKTVLRRLTGVEILRIFDLPLELDSLFAVSNDWLQQEPLPFQSAMSVAITTAVFRKLWSVDGGVKPVCHL